MESIHNKKEFFKRLINFLFKSLFVFWGLLAALELFMPGFVIYYISLNWLIVAVLILAFARLLMW